MFQLQPSSPWVPETSSQDFQPICQDFWKLSPSLFPVKWTFRIRCFYSNFYQNFLILTLSSFSFLSLTFLPSLSLSLSVSFLHSLSLSFIIIYISFYNFSFLFLSVLFSFSLFILASLLSLSLSHLISLYPSIFFLSISFISLIISLFYLLLYLYSISRSLFPLYIYLYFSLP